MSNKNISQLFGILPEFIDSYNEKVEIGKEYLKDKKIAIIGLARNIEKKIDNFAITFNRLREHKGTDFKAFIYENDSTDNTPSKLEELKTDKLKGSFDYISEINGSKHYGQVKDTARTEQLAYYRNKCLEYAQKNFGDTDYILVIDTDFIYVNIDGIHNTFGWISENKKISAMCGFSYQVKKYFSTGNMVPWNYDSWAYRQNWWSDTQEVQTLFNTMHWYGLWCPPLGSDPIPVNSGFGGTCIYKTKDYIKTQYEGYDCEHVCFNKSLKDKVKNFQLYANPAQMMILDIQYYE